MPTPPRILLPALALTASVALLGLGCSSSRPDPLKALERELAGHPQYSVVLQDMDQSGTFFTHYYHLYKVITGEEQAGQEGLAFATQVRDWVEVDKKFFERYRSMLGMVVLAKGEDGEVDRTSFPPGYQYVGNQRYGQWRQDSSGNSFWVFYGQYALFRDLLGMGTNPIYRRDYDDYRSTRRSGRPWFGSSRQYGTQGSYTRTANPTFYQRQQSRQATRSRSFSDKVRQRSGMSSSRGRSGARGK